MSTVLLVNGFRVSIRNPPREHGPAHVHVWKAGTSVVIELDPVVARSAERMRTADLAAAVRLVEANRQYLLEQWRKRHG